MNERVLIQHLIQRGYQGFSIPRYARDVLNGGEPYTQYGMDEIHRIGIIIKSYEAMQFEDWVKCKNRTRGEDGMLTLLNGQKQDSEEKVKLLEKISIGCVPMAKLVMEAQRMYNSHIAMANTRNNTAQPEDVPFTPEDQQAEIDSLKARLKELEEERSSYFSEWTEAQRWWSAINRNLVENELLSQTAWWRRSEFDEDLFVNSTTNQKIFYSQVCGYVFESLGFDTLARAIEHAGRNRASQSNANDNAA